MGVAILLHTPAVVYSQAAMVDYSQWKARSLSVTSLALDPKNPRIPRSENTPTQRDLIKELVEHDEAFELAQNIAEKGYFPLESLIGLVDEDDNKTYILEGNRRLCALKLLLSPESAPDTKWQSKFRGLSKNIEPGSIKKVNVLIAPSRQDAARLIMQKHTEPMIKQWDPIMKARYYRSLADDGLTAAEIAQQYGTTPGEVAQFLRADSTYELARRMDLPAAVRAKVLDPRSFQVTTVQRVLDTPKARELLALEFDKNGNIQGKVDREEFKKGFTRLISDVATEKENSRTLNSKSDIEEYLGRIKTDLPDRKKTGTFTVKDFEPPKNPEAPQPKPKATPKKTARQVRKSRSVLPSNARCGIKNNRIQGVFDELKGLSLEKNPNASAVMFRILLEFCVEHYLSKTKKMQPLLDRLDKKKNPNWCPTLRQMLLELMKDTTPFDLDRTAIKTINKMIEADTHPLSLDGLDQFVHNKHALPTAEVMRSYWEMLEGIFVVILDEPSPAPTQPSQPPKE